MKVDVSIVGLGNWGTSLAHALMDADVPLREIVVRAKPRRNPDRLPLVRLANAAFDARILWLCVPDAAIAPVAEQIASQRQLRGQRLGNQIVVHSSGALTVEALRAVRDAGAQVASVHPVMSFPVRKPVSLRGVFFGMEADASLRRTLYPVIRRLGGRPFALASNKKALYHAAGTMASPLLVSALTAAISTARLAGLKPPQDLAFVSALAETTARNVFTRGPARSFSGPFARGDVSTINLHLQALAGHPMLAEIYRSLARHAVEALPVHRKAALQKLLDSGSHRHKR